MRMVAIVMTLLMVSGCGNDPFLRLCEGIGFVSKNEVMVDKRFFVGEDLHSRIDDPVFRFDVQVLDVQGESVELADLQTAPEFPFAYFQFSEDYILLRAMEDDEVLSVMGIVRHVGFICEEAYWVDDPNEERASIEESGGRGRPWYDLRLVVVDWSQELWRYAYDQVVPSSVGSVIGFSPVKLTEQDTDFVIGDGTIELTTALDLDIAPPGPDLLCTEPASPTGCPRARVTLRYRWQALW